MKARIARHYSLSAAELREIVIQHLRAADRPAPQPNKAVDTVLNESGMTLEWLEEIESQVA